MTPDLTHAPGEVTGRGGSTMTGEVPEAPLPGGRPAVGPGPKAASGKWILEWLAVFGVALVLAVCVRTYVGQMFYIPSGSMLPTLQIGDRIVVDRLAYRIHGVQRGDIVVFSRPPLEQADYADLVKRVIGLPGETISSQDGHVYIDGQRLKEPWLARPQPVTAPSQLPDGFSLNHSFTVPAGTYFVMGDNRTDSQDSRYFGPIPRDLIVGKMAFKVWPVDDSVWLVLLSTVAAVVLVVLLLVLRGPREAHPFEGRRHEGPDGPG